MEYEWEVNFTPQKVSIGITYVSPYQQSDDTNWNTSINRAPFMIMGTPPLTLSPLFIMEIYSLKLGSFGV